MYTIKLFLFIAPLVISSRIDQDYPSFDSVSPEPKSRFAMLDDVKILANGLLQLGHGLKDFVHKTKGQINDIFQKLNIFDQSFYDLSLQTNEIKEEEKELRRTTSRLQVKNEEVKNMSLELNSKLESLLEEKILLQQKVRYLEDQLTNLIKNQPEIQEHPEITSLKVSIKQRGFMIMFSMWIFLKKYFKTCYLKYFVELLKHFIFLMKNRLQEINFPIIISSWFLFP